MANLLSMPSISVGLMGRRNQPQGNDLAFLQQLMKQSQEAAQFDAGDAYFTNPAGRPAGNGVPVLENGAVSYVPPTPGAAPAQRERVSGWRVLDRVLGGQTVTEGLDQERARLQAQADAPAQQERIQAALAAITDPRERALFLGLGGEDWQKNVGQQYAPQVVGAGAAQAVAGRRTVEQPSFTESGDTILARTSEGVTPVFTRTDPSITEQTAQNRLLWDQQYGAGQLGISAQNADTSRMNAETTAANAGVTLSPGQVRYDINGQPVASVAGAPSPAVAATAQAVAGFEANNDRFRNVLTMINGNPQTGAAPAFELSPTKAALYKAALATGIGMSPEAAAYGNYSSEIDAAVSDALRLNTGPQTDQDAIREARALLSNRDNKQYVTTRLPTIIANNERLARARQAGSPAATQAGSVARPTSAAEYQALLSGTLFMAPDGSTRRKP